VTRLFALKFLRKNISRLCIIWGISCGQWKKNIKKKMPIHFKFDPDELNRKYFDEEKKW
jgi:hypothetical protein